MPTLTSTTSNIDCTGNETELLQCDSTLLACPAQQTGAGMICHAPSTEEGNCSDGDIRLVNGTTVSLLEGRVEVCINNAWGTVCDRRFSEDDANIICRQTGHRHNGMSQFVDAQISIKHCKWRYSPLQLGSGQDFQKGVPRIHWMLQ